MTIAPSVHVADIVNEAPGTIAVFQRHEIEFCCGGHVPLEVVCENEGSPRLRAMLAKVVQRHGDRMPETLLPLQATFAELERDLPFT